MSPTVFRDGPRFASSFFTQGRAHAHPRPKRRRRGEVLNRAEDRARSQPQADQPGLERRPTVGDRSRAGDQGGLAPPLQQLKSQTSPSTASGYSSTAPSTTSRSTSSPGSNGLRSKRSCGSSDPLPSICIGQSSMSTSRSTRSSTLSDTRSARRFDPPPRVDGQIQVPVRLVRIRRRPQERDLAHGRREARPHDRFRHCTGADADDRIGDGARGGRADAGLSLRHERCRGAWTPAGRSFRAEHWPVGASRRANAIPGDNAPAAQLKNSATAEH